MTLRRIGLLLGALALVAMAVAGVLAWQARSWLDAPLVGLDEPATFEIERGSSLTAVADQLADRGLLEHPRVFTLWARLTDQTRGLKAGEYQLTPGITPAGLLELFHSGKVLLHAATFVEGMTVAEIRKVLVAHPAVQSTLESTSQENLLDVLGLPGESPEGLFFPDTYRFPRGTSDREILTMAYQRMQDELEAAWETRAPDLPLASPYEALILASIIEKETALDAERPVIGGVFTERLRIGMRLQSDPTVIYGIGETFDGDIRRADLRRDTPYNTYTRGGLPPTPIAAPGAASLAAAVRPEVTGALYFVATGNGDGSHYFSKTLPEHQAAVRRYLRKLRESR
ncbi:MAG TPA: endolytic transglycosylase MltG [Steroidobacteraceae bacterium]|nr:endolytic transglycosylase MltG [Steroidobacteraceae bacterium]